MEDPHDIEKYKGYEIGIFYDDDPQDPRGDDNLGKMVCWHSRHNLGDEQRRDSPEDWMREIACEVDPTVESRIVYWTNGKGWKSLENKYGTDNYSDKAVRASDAKVQAITEKALGKVVMLPLFLYDHSGLRMKVGSFQGLLPQGHAEFDSGQVGFIYITYEGIKKEYGGKRVTRAMLKKVEKYLGCEVDTYDDYLSGNVHGFMIRPERDDGEVEDWEGGCWGFFGNAKDSGLLDQAKDEVDHTIEEAKKTKEAE